MWRKEAEGTARWIQRTHVFRKDEYECSYCGHQVEKPTKECPFCGKIMKCSKYDPLWVDEMEMIDEIFDD